LFLIDAPVSSARFGACILDAAVTEHTSVIPTIPILRDQGHQINVALRRQHEAEYLRSGRPE
jgi:hypothetical protein